MNRISVIWKPGPPDSRSNVDTSETGPSLPHAAVRENSSVQMLQSITKVVEESRIVSAPGPSTSVVSRPGPSNQDIHQSIKDKNRYYACDKFDYFVGGIGVSDSETDGDNIIVNENERLLMILFKI